MKHASLYSRLCIFAFWAFLPNFSPNPFDSLPNKFPIIPTQQCVEEEVWLDMLDETELRVCLSKLLAVERVAETAKVWFQEADSIVSVWVHDPAHTLIEDWEHDYEFVVIHGNNRAVNPRNMGWMPPGCFKSLPVSAPRLVDLYDDCVSCEGQQRGGVMVSAPWVGTYLHGGRRIPLVIGVSVDMKEELLTQGHIFPYFGR